jgi:predicted ATPase with chaperone activity
MTTTAIAEPDTQPNAEPVAVADLGIEPSILIDLTLKTLYYAGRMTRGELSNSLKLSGPVMQELLQSLTQDALASVLGSENGAGAAGYTYTLTEKGRERADSAFTRSGYVGPAPVPLKDYVAQVEAQSVRGATVTREQILRALGPLVLADTTITRIGRAATSRKPTLVHGHSGNGKTTIVRLIGSVLGGAIRIPYALEIVGHIVHLYDPSKHVIVDDERATDGDSMLRERRDRRWVTIERPVVWAGGELTRQSLELVYDESARVYEAPLQLKANGGALIIDDFGRQQMPAVQLLNRWIVALEGGVDHLTLHTGQTIEIPFDVLIMFSTNLPPDRLADEAFLRRIRYKIEVPNPTRDEYRTIFRHECASRGVRYDDDAVTQLFERWYDAHHRDVRGCHPRDLVEAMCDAAEYESRPPSMSVDALDEACSTYFLRPGNAPT